jgi:hypothetical protein
MVQNPVSEETHSALGLGAKPEHNAASIQNRPGMVSMQWNARGQQNQNGENGSSTAQVNSPVAGPANASTTSTQ